MTGAQAAAIAAEAFDAGKSALAGNDLEAAEAAFRRALAVAPERAALHANLALGLERQGRADAAVACYRRALEIEPDNARVLLNFGALLIDRRAPEAEAVLLRAVNAAPDSPAAWCQFGVLHACAGRGAEAEDALRMALELDPEHAAARFNLAYVLLQQARFEEGWACFEARDWHAALASRLACPRWRGEALAGRRILIGHEAGHGDMIQFARHAIELKARGAARVGLMCPSALRDLFATLEGVDAILDAGAAPPAGEWDCWSPLMSLPHHLGIRADSIPARLPYLRAVADRIARWAARLPPAGLRVGLAWRGNPRFENDGERSLPGLATLAPLASVAGVRFVSLQKGAGEDEARQPPAGMTLLALGQEFGDFADTAAVIAQLDLVITVDSAVAHLAGALGVPCWILLPAWKTD